jgi:hypothetical protein
LHKLAWTLRLLNILYATVSNWGDGGAGNPCYAFVSSNTEFADLFLNGWVGPRHWTGEPISLVVSQYQVTTDLMDVVQGILFEEKSPGQGLWEWARSIGRKPIVICGEVGSDYAWPNLDRRVLTQIDDDFEGYGPLIVQKPNDERAFLEMCFTAQVRHLGLIAVPNDTPIDELTSMIRRGYNDDPVFDIRFLDSVPWVLGVGRTSGDISECFFASRDPRDLRRLGTMDGVRVVSIW